MRFSKTMTRLLFGAAALSVFLVVMGSGSKTAAAAPAMAEQTAAEQNDGIIKWVDFNVTSEALKKAVDLDVASHGEETPVNYVELLACLAAQNGNDFSHYRDRQLEDIAASLQNGTDMAAMTKNLPYYGYYRQAFEAVLAGLVGEYEQEVPNEDGGGTHWETRYGIKVFSPIAKNYPYSHYDDFGSRRTYGFERTHLGNDLMGQTGTPIVAVESGIVEALGWNQYGGWRIGIRSLDGKRYYYYAHLRQNFPYRKDLKEGDSVQAGDVIGYLGHTGYSQQENVNNIDTPHLHFGIQLIFDESQKECNNEIWIDVYQIVRLLDNYRVEVVKDPATKEYSRVYGYHDLSPLTE